MTHSIFRGCVADDRRAAFRYAAWADTVLTVARKSLVVVLAVVYAVGIGIESAAASQEQIRVSPQRMQEGIDGLSRFGANPEGGVSRVAFSQADIDGRKYIADRMRDAGLDVRVDEAGNLIGLRRGTEPDLPVIMIGSHIDSVPGGGNYDGDVGVIGSVEVARALHDNGIALRHTLEVVSFTDEEGGLTGSRAMTAGLEDSALDLESHSGLTIREGVRVVGGNPDQLERALRREGDLAAYVELHIEQGAILHEEDIDIGIVEGIVGIRWWDIVVEGFANHAGTTPMDRRRDAMLSAAALTLAVNEVAVSLEGRQVATVGRIRAEPGAPNVIPGQVVMSLEIRDLSAEKMQRVFDNIRRRAEDIEDRYATPIRFTELDVAAPPAPTDRAVRSIIEEAAQALGFSTLRMPSGAGHDAQDLAHIAPVGMIFVPSVDGISHSPQEYTSAEDMANGATVLLHTVLRLDSR